MNILLICDEYPPCTHGGIGTITRLLARELVNQGHEVTVVGFYPWFRKAASFENDCGVDVYRFFYGNSLSLKFSKYPLLGKLFNLNRSFNKYIQFLKDFIKEKKIQIVEIPDYHEIYRYGMHSSISYPNFDVPWLVKLHGNSTFFSSIDKVRSTHLLHSEKEKDLLMRAPKILSVSRFVKNQTCNLFNLQKDVEVVHNGIHIDASLIYTGNKLKPNVVYAGKLAFKKGIFQLLKAWNIIEKEFPEANLSIFGRGDPDTLNELYRLIKNLKIKSVSIQGFVDHNKLLDIYTQASCAVFPSYAESFGMAPLEAMAVGCPTIFSALASGPEIIESGVNGLLVHPDDIEGIAHAIKSLLLDPEYAYRLGKAGAEKVRQEFNIVDIAKSHIEHYKKLVEIL